MAQIILTGDEIIRILRANALIPEQVTEVEADGEDVRVRVRTPLPVLKSVRVGVRFAGFKDGHVILQLVTNRFIDAFDWIVDRMVESFAFDEHGGRWEYPRLYVDVNRLLQQQVRGMEITDIIFKDNRFHITTFHVADGGPDDVAAVE